MTYFKLLDEARAADSENGWAVTPKTAEELAQCKTFLSDGGGVGVAIAPDGDIEAAFHNRQRHSENGVSKVGTSKPNQETLARFCPLMAEK